MFDIHVCLVSAQAAPNLLPVLDEKLRPKEVILLVTEAMNEKAGNLQSVIQPTGIKVRIEPFSSTGDFQAMQEQLENLIKPYPSGKVALNVTGGTKWMAITAQEVFRFNNRPVFYVDIESDRVLFLDSNILPIQITAKIKVESYLKAYGYQILNEQRSCGLTARHRDFCQQMILHVTEWEFALGQLNRLAKEAERNDKLQASLSLLEKHDNHLERLLKECQSAQILNYYPSDNKIEFINDQTRFFANGGWLEEFINSQLNELKAEGILQDNSHLNLKIASAKSSNEIDVAFMAKNRLHLIECKTKRLSGQHTGSSGTESLYKLDSISDLGGLTTKAMLVSYRSLGKADAQRAKDLNIRVVQGEDIQRIKSIIRQWIG